MKAGVRKALYLWIDKGQDSNNTELLIQQLYECNRALDKMLDGRITPKTYLEILDANQVAIDSYLEVSNENLKLIL